MTLNRQRFLRYAEYAAVSASVAGAIAAITTRQLAYGIAPLSIATALNLASRRQWEQQIEQHLTQTTTQISQSFEHLVQQKQRLEQRLQALPQIEVEDFAKVSDIQSLRREGSRLFQQLADDLQILRQDLDRQDGGITRSDLDSITANLRQLQVSLAALESLNFEDRLQTVEEMLLDEQERAERAISQLRTDIDQVLSDFSQLQEVATRLQVLLRESPSTTPVSATYGVESEPTGTATPPPPESQWQPPQLPSSEDFDLELSLGIDFGTGFTKVCFRNLDNDY
jgi:hypothetical protein